MPTKMTLQDWRSGFGVVDPRDKEIITFAIWERQLYVSAATTALTYFAAATNGLGGNLPLGGQLANGTSFLIQAIRIMVAMAPSENASAAPADGVIPGGTNDVFKYITLGTFKLTVGDKEYGRWPIWMLPAGGGVHGNLAVAGTAAAQACYQIANNGVPDPRVVYTLPVPIAIPPQYSFRGILEWPTAITTFAATLTPYIFVVLDGQLMRPKQ